ncbi:DUF4956 domain-containing protein [Cellulomonas sp. PS-H5]|uniref:DUF4956 domain-containing protein n=1 Tax=Cellulomonas sp. PS-H5 TaxID=2820400 RepID=UPI001C50239B|nr:DUF4956 domain-containing protein [Cellulomonas sp. PS-H5]MBW0252736.1 DUF4956 domain-containing protein [Cellulomonas sp. PS-H5]
MPAAVLFAADLVAIAVLTFALYFPRHRRRDLVVAFLGVNVGVLAVAGALSTSTVGAGLGLGLFGVLSIIRLRSSEIDQREVAYYFAALALGLIGGLGSSLGALALVLMAMVLVALYAGDHPRLLRGYRQQVVVVDRAFGDHAALVAHLEQLLGARVHGATVQRLDLVDDTTVVDVRYAAPPTGARGGAGPRVRTRATPSDRRGGAAPASSALADDPARVGSALSGVAR